MKQKGGTKVKGVEAKRGSNGRRKEGKRKEPSFNIIKKKKTQMNSSGKELSTRSRLILKHIKALQQ